MSPDVASVGLDTPLTAIVRLLDERRISAVPVLDEGGAITGVVSRADLVRVGRIQAGSHRKSPVLTLPQKTARELVRDAKRRPLVIASIASLRDAARTMLEERVHRLFVVDDGRLHGVISTFDLMAAVRDARIDPAITEIMSTPLFTIQVQQPISAAVERLAAARVTGLVVLENDYPVGVFTQLEAMQARDLPRDTRVEDVFDAAMLCLPTSTKIFRAAEQAHRLNARRVLPCNDRGAVGIVTGFDFARLIAKAQ